jgi:hypothetical protein
MKTAHPQRKEAEGAKNRKGKATANKEMMSAWHRCLRPGSFPLLRLVLTIDVGVL